MAKYATPNKGVDTHWPKYVYNDTSNAADKENFIKLETPLKSGNDLLRDKCNFWDHIVETLEKHGEY